MNSGMILTIPDVHGRAFWKDALDWSGKVIFLGDYLDALPGEDISAEDALDNFKSILKFAETSHGRVILLLGDHDVQYFDHRYVSDSCDNAHRDQIGKLFLEHRELFNVAQMEDKTLFTHAGVNAGWLRNIQANGRTSMDYGDVAGSLNRMFNDDRDAIMMKPSANGDEIQFGGPMWSTCGEMHIVHSPFANIYQVFGHSQMKNSGETCLGHGYACIDSQACFVVRTDSGQVEKYSPICTHFF
jgi:hypothetical protein